MAEGNITVEVSTQTAQAELERLRADNAALRREAHSWWTAARDALKLREPLAPEVIEAAAAEAFGYEGGLQQVNLGDLLHFARVLEHRHGIGAQRNAAQRQEQDEPVAVVELMKTGGNVGLATRIVEIDDHLRERLRPGTKLYTHPAPQRQPLTDEEIVDIWADVSMGYDDEINIIELARAIERAHVIGGQDEQM